MKQSHVMFPCGALELEGALHLPDGNGRFPAVIVCHPHPLYGGDMNNNVVLGICGALIRQSIAAFRFNFQGAGGSGGVHGEGVAEQEDIKAALTFVSSSPDIDAQRLGLAGYSFGASVAAPVAIDDARVRLLALVSPALSDPGWKELQKYIKPKFLITGSDDFVISEEKFERYVKSLPEPKQYEIMGGVDHFWQWQEDEMGDKVARFFASGFAF